MEEITLSIRRAVSLSHHENNEAWTESSATQSQLCSAELRVWGSMQQCSVVSVEEKKGAENEVQLVLLPLQQPKNMGSFTLVFVSSSLWLKGGTTIKLQGW